MKRFVSLALAAALSSTVASGAARVFKPDGSVAKDDFFPIAVWLQSPHNAPRYKAAGINLYVGLWNGPTEAQLADLRKADMPVICDQNAVALKHVDDPLLAAWMHGDEPDNAQELPGGKGYGPPIAPEKIVADFEKLHAADPTRPVLLNLGQGVAWDGWYGRGVRSRHPEDYAAYVKGCHIASFDIYPVNHDSPEVAGKLEYVPRGVRRLREWAGPGRPVWNCIECTGIGRPEGKPTPAQVRAQVWMSLIAGSRGLVYFVHQFKPTFREAALLDDAEMLAEVTALNKQVRSLARVLNAAALPDAVSAKPSREGAVHFVVKPDGPHAWLFAANESAAPVTCAFTLKNAGIISVTADGAGPVALRDRAFTVAFEPHGVCLYRLESDAKH